MELEAPFPTTSRRADCHEAPFSMRYALDGSLPVESSGRTVVRPFSDVDGVHDGFECDLRLESQSLPAAFRIWDTGSYVFGCNPFELFAVLKRDPSSHSALEVADQFAVPSPGTSSRYRTRWVVGGAGLDLQAAVRFYDDLHGNQCGYSHLNLE